jgi:hypothetical protein
MMGGRDGCLSREAGDSTVVDTPVTLGSPTKVNGVSMFGAPGMQG